MPVIVGLFYVGLLTLVLTYAVGGFGLGVGIVALLVYVAFSELWKAYTLGQHPEDEEHAGHHHGKHAHAAAARKH
jgi:hypothetical protein